MADHPLNDVPSGPQVEESADDVRRLFWAKVLAEVARADALAPGSDAISSRGNPLARVLVLKGRPGPAEASGGAAVSGADGEAVTKGLVALGYRESDAFFALTRPDPAIDPERRSARIAALIEAVDPIVTVALDEDATEDLALVLGTRITPANPAEVDGRRYVAVGGFEAALASEARKRVVWRQLKAAAPEGPIY